MSGYAENTQVTSGKSRDEIEKTLTRYGASAFMYGWEDNTAIIMFKMDGYRIKFVLPMPNRFDSKFTKTETGRERSTSQAEAAYEQAVRQRWRALALVIKAKLEAVASGITIFEDEFLARIELPDGNTVGHFMKPQLKEVYSKGSMPKKLLMLTTGDNDVLKEAEA